MLGNSIMGNGDGKVSLNNTVLGIVFLGYFILFMGTIALNWYLKDFVFENVLIHSTIEISGAIVSLIIAILILILRKQNQIAPLYSWMAYAFVSMGVFDMLHASVTPGNLFVWLHSGTVLTGGLFFAAICMPKQSRVKLRNPPPAWLVTASVVAIGVLSILFPHYLPRMIENNHFTVTARSFNIIGGILFLGAFVHFLLRFKKEQLMDDFIFVNLSLLFGVAGLLFETSQIWNIDWWSWHILRLIAYTFVFYYLFLNFHRINAKLLVEIKERKAAEEALRKKTFDLNERVKELNCLYRISELIEKPEVTLVEIFQGIVNLIPPSWQFPDITCSRIIFNGVAYTSEKFKATNWRQAVNIDVNGKQRGVLEVYYLEKRLDFDEGPFLSEEWKLINSIVKLLSKIIERKQADEALKSSELKYRNLFNSITYGYAIHELIVDNETNEAVDYRFLEINQAFDEHTNITTVTGLELNEIIGKTVLEVMPDIEKEWIRKYGQVALTGEAMEFEAPANALGKQYHVIAFQNQPGQFAVMFSDITERKQVEEALRKQSQAVEQSGSTIVITDLKGTIEYANPAFSKVSGFSKEEAIGKNANILKSGQHPGKFYQEMWNTILGGDIWRGEMINQKKCGDIYWELATISPVMDSSGKISHFVAIKDDITQRKQLEGELLIAKKDAETANQTKSEFLSNISHEIRTPMHQILSFAKFGVDKTDKVAPEKLRHYFSKIDLIGKNLLSLLNNLLDLSKVESGKMNYEMSKNDLKKVIENVANEFAPLIEEKELALEIVNGNLPTETIFDEAKIAQVVRNILSNAIKFTHNNRNITISFQLGKLVKESETHGKSVIPGIETSIKDEGLGIPKEELNSIFDKFIQSSKTKTGAGGTGLGLAICRDIIEAHNGDIWAENNPESGSTFKFTIPYLSSAQG